MIFETFEIDDCSNAQVSLQQDVDMLWGSQTWAGHWSALLGLVLEAEQAFLLVLIRVPVLIEGVAGWGSIVSVLAHSLIVSLSNSEPEACWSQLLVQLGSV